MHDPPIDNLTISRFCFCFGAITVVWKFNVLKSNIFALPFATRVNSKFKNIKFSKGQLFKQQSEELSADSFPAEI